MNSRMKMARDLVKTAKMLLAFKGAQQIMENICNYYGLSMDDELVNKGKDLVIDFITQASTVDGKVRDFYYNWLKNRAMNSNDLSEMLDSVKDEARISMFFKMQFRIIDFKLLPSNLKSVHDAIEMLVNRKGSPDVQSAIDDINSDIADGASINTVLKSVRSIRNAVNPSNDRANAVRHLEETGAKKLSIEGFNVYEISGDDGRKTIIDLANACTEWCISMKDFDGDGFYRRYSDKYYVICYGNKPYGCAYKSNGKVIMEFDDCKKLYSDDAKHNEAIKQNLHDNKKQVIVEKVFPAVVELIK